ncbi:MAG: hypothetical protein JXA38_00450, partial [Methanosarcinaceae archaeon]|nr:hypothetical protein [Methanosarcinaceae archaeon]
MLLSQTVLSRRKDFPVIFSAFGAHCSIIVLIVSQVEALIFLNAVSSTVKFITLPELRRVKLRRIVL